jgi:hypothetical protein
MHLYNSGEVNTATCKTYTRKAATIEKGNRLFAKVKLRKHSLSKWLP